MVPSSATSRSVNPASGSCIGVQAKCENRIKELKYEFGAIAFNMYAVHAPEGTLNMTIIAYNLMRLFKRVLLKSTHHQGGQAE